MIRLSEEILHGQHSSDLELHLPLREQILIVGQNVALHFETDSSKEWFNLSVHYHRFQR